MLFLIDNLQGTSDTDCTECRTETGWEDAEADLVTPSLSDITNINIITAYITTAYITLTLYDTEYKNGLASQIKAAFWKNKFDFEAFVTFNRACESRVQQ